MNFENGLLNFQVCAWVDAEREGVVLASRVAIDGGNQTRHELLAFNAGSRLHAGRNRTDGHPPVHFLR